MSYYQTQISIILLILWLIFHGTIDVSSTAHTWIKISVELWEITVLGFSVTQPVLSAVPQTKGGNSCHLSAQNLYRQPTRIFQ